MKETHLTKSTMSVSGIDGRDIITLCGLSCAPTSEYHGAYQVGYMNWYPINREKLKGNLHEDIMCPKCMELVELEIAIHSLSLTVE